MKTASLRVLGLLIGLVILCLVFVLPLAYSWRERDVTNDPAFGNFNQIVVGTWRTKVPLVLYEGDFEADGTLGLIHDWSNPNWRKLADIPLGTEIRVERLKYKMSLERSYLWITGSLVNGEYAGKSLELDNDLFPPKVMFHYRLRNKATTKPSWSVIPEMLEKRGT